MSTRANILLTRNGQKQICSSKGAHPANISNFLSAIEAGHCSPHELLWNVAYGYEVNLDMRTFWGWVSRPLSPDEWTLKNSRGRTLTKFDFDDQIPGGWTLKKDDRLQVNPYLQAEKAYWQTKRMMGLNLLSQLILSLADVLGFTKDYFVAYNLHVGNGRVPVQVGTLLVWTLGELGVWATVSSQENRQLIHWRLIDPADLRHLLALFLMEVVSPKAKVWEES